MPPRRSHLRQAATRCIKNGSCLAQTRGNGSALPLPWGEGWGERLSGESSCIGVLGTRIACFCVEANEQFASQCNADDHFFFSCGEQPGTEVAEAFVVARGDGRDEE